MSYQTDEEYCNEVMQGNVDELAEAVVGHRIVSATPSASVKDRWGRTRSGFVITLDNGKKVIMSNTDDCCAYTELNNFLLYPDRVDHVIVGVTSGDDFSTWHIYADMGDVLSLDVGWSSGNTGYYGFGFGIEVVDA